MSIRVMSAVWDLALPDSEKLVALALADWCDDNGKCWPSVAQIAAKCSKSVRTVQGALVSLEGKGFLRRDMIAGKGTIYHLTPAAAVPRSDCTPADDAPPQGTTQTPAAAAPNTSVTTISSETNVSSENSPQEPEKVLPEHIVEAWNETAQRCGLPTVRTVNDTRAKHLRAMIRKRSIAEIADALRAIERCRWMHGENDRGWRVDFDFILSPTKFDRLIEGSYDRQAKPS